MKNRAFSLLASIALLSFASCTDEVQELANEQSQALKQIVMTTQDFQPEADSRTVYQIADGVVKCTWASNDTVGVFPDEGAQAYFPMASGAGTKNASFDGKGWALKDGYTYASYYPYIGKAYLDRNAVPVSYTGQTQVGNASLEHLGTYDYMVATPTAPEFGSAQFMFKHISALVQLKLTIPQPTTLTSVKLVTDTKVFAVEGTVDIMANAPSITPATSSTEVVLNLQNVATTKENEVVTCYFMLPPSDLSKQTLKAVLVSDKGNVEVDLESKNFQAGTAYALSGEMKGNYKNGVATLVKAGTLQQLLGDDWLEITSLKVLGPINGDDVRCLRQMLGGNIENGVNIEKGKLTALDLSDASIVEGGSYYYFIPKARYYYTSNDEIGDYMFDDCTNLQNIQLPIGVSFIGFAAFSDCSSLTTVDIPDSVTEIESYIFNNCSSLTSIDIPNSVTSIGNRAFANCSSLTSIDIPNSVTSIGTDAFTDCSSLTSIDIPDGVTEIGIGTFNNCSSLPSINIPNSVTSIGVAAFANCSSLTSIDIPNGVTEIGSSAFSLCTSLTSIDIPDGVTEIGENVFGGCSSLISIVIPDGVAEIGYLAFAGCSSLKSVTIGKGVTEIGNSAFAFCNSLAQVYCQGTIPPTINLSSGNSSFSGSGSSRTLYVPKGCSSAYQSSGWASFFGSIQEME